MHRLRTLPHSSIPCHTHQHGKFGKFWHGLWHGFSVSSPNGTLLFQQASLCKGRPQPNCKFIHNFHTDQPWVYSTQFMIRGLSFEISNLHIVHHISPKCKASFFVCQSSPVLFKCCFFVVVISLDCILGDPLQYHEARSVAGGLVQAHLKQHVWPWSAGAIDMAWQLLAWYCSTESGKLFSPKHVCP